MPPYPTTGEAQRVIAGSPFPGPSRLRQPTADDDRLARLYIRMWELASGRRLRRDVRPEQLTEEELIGFWADDLTPASGRHTAEAGRKTPRAA